MLEKALDSFKSAKILRDANEPIHYCMSAQCAYYGALQMALLMNQEKFDADQLYKWYQVEKGKEQDKRGGSHTFYITRFKAVIYAITGSRFIANDLHQILLDLKVIRHDAAYKANVISIDDVNQAIKGADKITTNVPGYITMHNNKAKITK